MQCRILGLSILDLSVLDLRVLGLRELVETIGLCSRLCSRLRRLMQSACAVGFVQLACAVGFVQSALCESVQSACVSLYCRSLVFSIALELSGLRGFKGSRFQGFRAPGLQGFRVRALRPSGVVSIRLGKVKALLEAVSMVEGLLVVCLFS